MNRLSITLQHHHHSLKTHIDSLTAVMILCMIFSQNTFASQAIPSSSALSAVTSETSSEEGTTDSTLSEKSSADSSKNTLKSSSEASSEKEPASESSSPQSSDTSSETEPASEPSSAQSSDTSSETELSPESSSVQSSDIDSVSATDDSSSDVSSQQTSPVSEESADSSSEQDTSKPAAVVRGKETDAEPDSSAVLEGGDPDLPEADYSMPTKTIDGISVLSAGHLEEIEKRQKSLQTEISSWENHIRHTEAEASHPDFSELLPLTDIRSSRNPLYPTRKTLLKAQILSERKKVSLLKEELKNLNRQKNTWKLHRIFNPNNVTVPSNLSSEETRYLLQGTYMENLADSFVECEHLYHVNSVFLMAIAAHESNWGRSRRAVQDHNYTGLGVYSPSAAGISADSGSINIRSTARLLHEKYLTKGGAYFNGLPVNGVARRYCASGGWADSVVHIGYQMMAKIVTA